MVMNTFLHCLSIIEVLIPASREWLLNIATTILIARKASRCKEGEPLCHDMANSINESF